MKHNFLAKLLFLAIAISLLLKTAAVIAAVLDVPEKFQEQDQWCWAGASQAIMQYYGTVLTQTAIAGYGTNGYNTWNYLYGSDSVAPYYRKGINMILNNWGLSCTYGYYAMSQVEVQNQIDSSRPFVIRWGWYSGGGHFIDGRGIEGDSVYYMDPWPGEGYKIALYSWVVDNGIHQWTHSLELTTYPSPQTPTVTTTAVSLVTSNSASSGGNVTSDGGASVTARGVCWRTSANPTTSDSKTTDGSGTGSFTSSITGLIPGTTYHVRAYATNSEGTGYGSDISFTTSSLPACSHCSGDPVVLQNVTFSSDTACECSAATSITIGTGVTIKSGATVIFKAPTVKLQSGFHAEEGSVVSIRQE